MNIKIFTSEEEANKFTDTVDLGDKGSVQYADGQIIIFYSHFKSSSKKYSLEQTTDALQDTVFLTKLRLRSLQTDLSVHQECNTDDDILKTVQDSIKETEKNLKMYKARLKMYETELLHI